MNPKSRVLVVDDEPAGLAVVEAFLQGEYELLFAASGQDAIKVAGEQALDAVLLDVMMPGMDGFETCRRLRAHPKLAEVPIIMLTALDDAESKLEAMRAGADDFLCKPINSLDLRARVRTITRLFAYHKMME